MKKLAHQATSPSIFDSSDLLLLLEEQCKLQISRGYSWRQISREADLGAPNLLQLVLAGKRKLHERHLENLIRFFKWNKEEAEFVRLLYRLQDSTETSVRNQVYQQILGLGTMKRIQILNPDQYEYFSDWLHPVVRELAPQAPSRKNAVGWIAERLMPTQSPDSIRRSLNLLERLGLVFPLLDRYKQKDSVISTPSQAHSILVGNFHRQVLAKASESISAVPRERRDLRTICMSLTKSQQKNLRERMDAFWAETLQICETHSSVADSKEPVDVCQFSMQYFPFTKAT